eukprot:760511-Hanusia_phi.AAC.2
MQRRGRSAQAAMCILLAMIASGEGSVPDARPVTLNAAQINMLRSVITRNTVMQPSESPLLQLRGGAPSSKIQKVFKELMEEVYTRNDPGQFKGKEDKHVPVMTRNENGVRVEVMHVMDEEGPDTTLHYIEMIWIQDAETGEVLNAKFLTPDMDTATAEFKGDYNNRKLVAYAMCNLHGTWASGETPK